MPGTNGGSYEEYIMSILKNVKSIFPGFLVTFLVAISAKFLSNNYGAPTILFAILLGMSLHFLYTETLCEKGIDFASKYLLQLGIILLGFGVTWQQIVKIGFKPLSIVLSGIILTVLIGPILARLLNRGWRIGILTSAAVAICGASAALAISSILPKNKFSEQNTLFTIVSVTTLSTLTMIVYPLLVRYLNMDDFSAGVFLGASIHDVAQVVGAGYGISKTAGDTATLIKMVRVASLFPIVLILLFFLQKRPQSGALTNLPIPFFIVGFLMTMFFNSTENFPENLKFFFLDLSAWCIALAISAIGMKTALSSLRHVGYQAILLIVFESIFLMTFVLVCVLNLI